MDFLTGKNGLITNAAKELGQNIFGSANKATTDALNVIKPKNVISPDKVPVESRDLSGVAEGEPSKGIFSSITSKLEKGLSGITGFFKDFKLPDFSSIFKDFKLPDFSSIFKNFDISSIFSIFGFAEGGKVSGAGSGTSDSIPAMLSNGEFVINAKATRDHIGLLTSINSGKLKKFAEGGLVSTAMLAAPAIADVKPAQVNNQSSQQVINLTITGDISRQTKAEIYQMLPSIAEGVNAHNRERGYR
jgi:hypothetical protein